MCSVLNCAANIVRFECVCCSVFSALQCVAVCCSMMQFVVDPLNVFCSKFRGENHVFVLCVAVRCSV